MKQSLQLRIGQQLTMTPQLQQAIRLLQLSSLELRTEIQQALESNFMLELDEEGELEQQEQEQHEQQEQEAREDEAPASDPAGDDIPEDLPLDTSWDDIYDGSTALSAPGDEAAQRDTLDNRPAASDSLQQHLHAQIELEAFSARERSIAEVIVDAVGDDGYLTQSTDDLLAGCPEDEQVDAEELEAVLQRVQRLDPTGVAARDPQEALCVQLEQLPEDTPWREEARHALLEHLGLIAERRYDDLGRALGVSDEALGSILGLIQSLDPRPGSQISDTTPDYVIPDVLVVRRDGAWQVELNSETAPRLRVNAYYASLIRRADRSADNHCLRNHLQEARWLIKSLRSRNETLLKVASAIVERQQGFLDHGEEAMQPLVLREIAEAVEMHESTISRITTSKYMHTPRGTFEFKYFFSSHVQTSDGGEASATAIRARIRRLIAEEDRAKPLSDSAIARILHEEGIQVARRTVAKYRESLSIASSAERKEARRR
ncbi:RNA polymerase factor sigma-54 [Halorhodospira halophila]|nr:RNA polymerase factor sigma-54 [Halorhodospira halophila]MBK1727987.1 RNA polymerase sigma-54 factor [Halorhodospira halophila]